jgi:hypothetical protein
VEEAVVTVCIAISRAEFVRKFNAGGERERERVKERRDKLTRGVMLDTSPRSRDITIANRIKAFKICLLNA